MTLDEIIAAASEKTGLVDTGDASFKDGLERLLVAYANEAKLSERGSGMAHDFLIGQLAKRMQFEDWHAKHTALANAPIEKPLFVFGLPRTGTTMMIQLLAADPAARSFLRWESAEPLPPAKPEELHAGPRFDATTEQNRMAKQYMPHIAAIHWEDADSPTECQFLMTPSFCSQVYDSQFDIPSYHQWFLHEADYRPAFRYHKRMLQALQTYAGGRWTLKNPWHPLYLDALTEVYPDARLVMTHRDPADVVGSACSLIKHVRRIYSDDVDLLAIGSNIIETFETMIARTNAFKAKHGQNAIFDVQYADTIRDPMGSVRSIYDIFGEPLTAEAEAAMQGWIDANPKGKHGKHEYTLEEFGLERGQVHELFKAYIEDYDIPVKA